MSGASGGGREGERGQNHGGWARRGEGPTTSGHGGLCAERVLCAKRDESLRRVLSQERADLRGLGGSAEGRLQALGEKAGAQKGACPVVREKPAAGPGRTLWGCAQIPDVSEAEPVGLAGGTSVGGERRGVSGVTFLREELGGGDAKNVEAETLDGPLEGSEGRASST